MFECSILYVIVCLLMKENVKTMGDNTLSDWKANVSSMAKPQNTGLNLNYHPIPDLVKGKNKIQKVENRLPLCSVTNISKEIKTRDIQIYQDKFNSNSPNTTTVNLQKRLKDRSAKKTNYSPFSENCYNIPVFMSVCPQGFTHIYYEGKNLCYILLANQTFPPHCPYSQHLPYYEIVEVLHRYFKEKDVWLHVYRNTSKFGFAHFEWIENGFQYGQPFQECLLNETKPHANCLILRNRSIYRVSCLDKHYSLCVYSAERLQSLYLIDMCKRRGYDDCIIGDYNLERINCYCKYTNKSQPEKSSFCEKLAEPRQPFQTQLLIDYLKLDSDMCWFGLRKSVSTGTYKWLSTNKEVNYTRWAKPENCENPEGAFRFGGSPYNGWTSATDRTLMCAICEFVVPFNRSALELKFISSKNKIELRITNLVSVIEPTGVGLHCFSDSNSNEFKQREEIVYINAELNSNVTIVKLQKVADYPSYYWCEAFEYSTRKIIGSNTILVCPSDKFGNEFAIITSHRAMLDPFIHKVYIFVRELIETRIKEEYDSLEVLRLMRGHYNEHEKNMMLLMHLTTKQTNQTIDQTYKQIYKILADMSATNYNMELIEFHSCESCLPNTTVTCDNETLEWPETKMGSTAIPSNKLCLDENNNMLPVTRKCEGDFLYGAKWADPMGSCSMNTTYSETTERLFDLVHSNAPVNEKTDELIQMTEEKVHSHPIDVHLVSMILENLVAEAEEVENDKFSTIISNVMHFDKQMLQDAQRLLNSTDKILSSVDNYMQIQDPLLLVSPRMIVQVSDLKKSDVTGLVLYKKINESENFASYKIEQLNTNSSFENLLNHEDLDTAVLFPANALDIVSQQLGPNHPVKLVIIIFYNDLLFNEKETSGTVQESRTKIASTSIPGFSGELNSSIKIAFRMPKNYLNIKNCSHWLYGFDPFMVSTYGEWKTDNLSQENSNLLQTCEFFHMTHYGVLLQNDPKEAQYNEIVLDILTIIGSALSLIGILPIFVTAILFKSWRSRPGNIILLNFCISITLQIVVIFTLNAVYEDRVLCKIIGVSLHYLVLSEFCWMFVVALLQHRRFVMVFKPQESTIVRKCLVVGWCFPLVPVIITVSVSVDNYKINSRGFCTIVGYYYIFGYMLPIILILCSNAFIFIRIIYNVSRQNTETCSQRNRNYKLEILLALFLFFVLGLTWVFGIIGALGGGAWSTYIFCITATLRGLVLFLFFIAGNKETRLMWKSRSTYYMQRSTTKRESTPSSNATTVSE